MLIAPFLSLLTPSALAEDTRPTINVVITCSPDNVEKMKYVPIKDLTDGTTLQAYLDIADKRFGVYPILNKEKATVLDELRALGGGHVYETIYTTVVGIGLGSDRKNPAIACPGFDVENEATWLTANEIATALKGKANRYVSFLDVSRDREASLEVATFGPNANDWTLGANNFALSAAAPGNYNEDGFLKTLTSVLSSPDALSLGEFIKRMRKTGIDIDASLTMHAKGIGMLDTKDFPETTIVDSWKEVTEAPVVSSTATLPKEPLKVTPRAIAWSAGGVCLAGAAVIGGLMIPLHAELASDNWHVGEEDEWHAGADRFGAYRTAALSLTGCGVAGGVAGFFLGPNKEKVTAVSFTPTPLGVSATIRW